MVSDLNLLWPIAPADPVVTAGFDLVVAARWAAAHAGLAVDAWHALARSACAMWTHRWMTP